ncbi:AlwI family type II restriction endonuclease [Lactococcus lactis]|uniref:AlwI family type II restriction endonuclease n=2 Tax=Streptococcaceae TaxID=1300 RepID=UPI00288D1397|nr:AlwI family type II restriction endonuclease [Lactococcus lactis]MDT2874160.1 AlwI family type II restriction endonuclease [Lactococcus lactis]MDT2925563.1 AlwI family type II restriction endonuclease [Lactococcus lactis]MDT2936044.1 AlwI family type II restriction endonuclease [Lactococcus lactis]MDT2952684.1 AlwI family type II restriction endonuclease [Lactococcus lactis]
MKVSNGSTFNLGDTSFRRKTLLDDYKTLLPILRKHNTLFPNWNNDSQIAYYQEVMAETDLFERSESDDPAKRSRTLTNALIKSGLINDKRKLSEVANNWIDDKIENFDDLEKALGISKDNLVFFRQFIKLRVYDNSNNYFYPFRVALKFLTKYQNVPETDFLVLLHSISSNNSEQSISELIEDYSEVASNNQTFGEYIAEHFSDSSADKVNAKLLFSKTMIDAELFYRLFSNRKTPASQVEYIDFVTNLLNYKLEKNEDNLKKLLASSKKSSVKKAFGFNKLPFESKRTIEEFEEANLESDLLDSDNTKIYFQFSSSKKYDLVREYKDMTKRSFNLTGIISFANGLVNLENREVIEIIISNIDLSGNGQYRDYESNLDSIFYKDLATTNILGLDLFEITKLREKIVALLGTESFDMAVRNQKEKKFRNIIKKEFPKSKIQELLPMFITREDEKIQEMVTDLAKVPDIFEYILAIAWFYLSDTEYSIIDSLKLPLDANFKPLGHASGGDGDIIINHPNLTIMLEATLMKKNVQKRGELEPVIRHATNLSISSENKVKTIFVADELDDNLINIFRATTYIELEGTNVSGKVNGVNIFALTISEIMKMLEFNIPSSKVFNAMNNHFTNQPEFVKCDWRNSILQEIF